MQKIFEKRTYLLFVFSILLLAIICSRAAQSAPVACCNLAPGYLKGLASVGAEQGLELTSGITDISKFTGPILLWEAKPDHGISPEQAKMLGEYVRKGGHLILSVYSGWTPMNLAFMLPTTGWQAGISQNNPNPYSGPVTINNFDGEIFANNKLDLVVPSCLGFKPVSAVERGEGRYERFERTIQHINQKAMPGETFWTRPLNNRDWRIRARANDNVKPFLLTGSYGAGRVVVLNCSAVAVERCSQAKEFWRSILGWLAKNRAASTGQQTNVKVAAPVIQVDAAKRELQVTLVNNGTSPVSLHVLARVLTWEKALIGDVEKPATVPAKSKTVVSIKLPDRNDTAYQAIEASDVFDVRLGVLSDDYSTILSEQRLPADMRTPVVLSAQSDNTRAIQYPFAAPNAHALFYENRMGLPLGAYAYRPGQTVNIRGTIANGGSNLTPLAQVFDEAQPDNPTLKALTDGAVFSEKVPQDGIEAYGVWVGLAQKNNSLRFVFPHPVMIDGITIIGAPTNFRNYLCHNPSAAIIELDGKVVSNVPDLGQRFLSALGNVRIALTPKMASEVRIILPAVNTPAMAKVEPWLGDLQIEGAQEFPAPVKDILSVKIFDSLGSQATASTQTVQLAPGASERFDIPIVIPSKSETGFYRVELSFAGQTCSIPFLSINPKNNMRPVTDILPPNASSLGFIVTKGFRNVFDIGTGTKEQQGGWSTPDDLIWAYSRQFKEISQRSVTEANRLYLTESDMRHYSTPWRSFANGELFYDIAAPLIVQHAQRNNKWNSSRIAGIFHSDRWDCGPNLDNLHGWQDFEEFNKYLLAKGVAGLQGQTLAQLSAEIHRSHESEWQQFQLDRYRRSINNLKNAFTQAGKELVISAQNYPLLPLDAEKEISETLKGMNQDSAWGMVNDDVTLTTGVQLGHLAFNPDWKMSTLLQWGSDSAVLENPHCHSPVGTTEPSRRQYYDRAWRSIVDLAGNYHAMSEYGYSQQPFASYTMTQNDWQQWWNLGERHGLIGPEAPLGAGIIISSSLISDPAHVAFSGTGIVGNLTDVSACARSLDQLQSLGLSIPFAANVRSLDKWNGTAPLVILNLDHFSADEIAILNAISKRGVPLVAFAGKGVLSANAAAIFGVHPDGSPAAAKIVAKVDNRSVTQYGKSLLISGQADDITYPAMQSLAPLLRETLQNPVCFPVGTSGYGFKNGALSYIVIEDWLEEGRHLSVRVKASAGAKTALACDLNEHRSLKVTRDGDWWTIELPTRPGDANVICLKEDGNL